MPEVTAQPNEEAASHHNAVTAQRQDTSAQALPATLDVVTRQADGGADPNLPHLFNLASTASSDDADGSLQGAIAAECSIL